ncbi:carbohydrate ABC transporter permease [Aestuariivirga litoralis]|uniref:carbohydrate ABC transporter permease n=1 Tax=Aestuariivirga litoralis TaxID=2650924 RepID=UPI0018C55EB7|nr:sugar ABC transporter permease [Aestuariivirga litoralis]MBG1232543.1 sugar ABC transporter permease [Aestuariivirga litoralis]
MATSHAQRLGRWALAPSVVALVAWAFVPLSIAIYFAFLRYNLQNDNTGWMGLNNFYYFIKDPYFVKDFINTLVLVLSTLAITVVGGIGLAILLDQPFWGRGIVRVLMISPFFIMPTVSSLVWKNLIMHPVFGLFAEIQKFFGATEAFDWFSSAPLLSVILIVSWQWLPYAALILLTSLQSLDEEQKAASQIDGAGPISYFRYIVLPHLARPITVVILIETIFLLNIFAEIKVTSVGAFAGNLTYLVFSELNDATDIGEAAAGGLIAVVLANIVSIFLVRIVGRNLEN